jgi:phenylalanyl-tRNA synthetase beta chain
MKVPINWLKEYVDITIPLDELARKLTMAGFEVSDIITIGGWQNVVVAQVKAINPHPNADKLRLPTLDIGGEEITVVCGAPNLALGDKVVFAKVGAVMTDAHTGKTETLKAARIRGVESCGMVCSERELGLSDAHEGIMVLPADAPVGMALDEYMGDVVFDFELTPNRADCLSVIGIARETAALTGQTVHLPDTSYEEKGEAIEGQITIDIQAPDLCPRYSAGLVKNVTIAESPAWMKQRLTAAGLRPINNLVDVTNYVMLEYGQPLHSFDYDRIRGKKIIVRRASDYEPFTTLDGNQRELNSGMLVISDVMGAVAVAGVMGGANSEVTEKTTSILLEAANFNARSIHYTGRTLGIPSEACMRYERGISRELTVIALKRAVQLLVELGGGEAAQGILDEYPEKLDRKPVMISETEVKRCLGIGYTAGEITGALEALGCECQPADSEGRIMVTAPYWRTDLNITVDFIEEVARVIGYDRIPMTLIGEPIPAIDVPPVIGVKRDIVRRLAGFGMQEVFTYTLTSFDMIRRISTAPVDESVLVKVSNPMTADQEYLRPSLRMNVLAAVESNRRYEDGGIRLFEAGKVFIRQPDDLPDEHEMLCGVIAGVSKARSWHGEGEPSDFYDAKGMVEGLLAKWGIIAVFEKSADKGLHVSRQAAVTIDGTPVGVIGEVHPAVRARFDIDEPVYLFEIDVAALLPFTSGLRKCTPLPRFPSVIRDMALIIDTGVTHRQVTDIVKKFSLVSDVEIFDVYAGKQVPDGKKSMAYRLIYQSADHTLTDKEVNKVQEQILRVLTKELGAELRGQG